MKILFVAAEVAPFVSVGGLSQVMYFLPRALRKLDHDVRIFTPKYGTIDTNPPKGKPWDLEMEYEGLRVPVDTSKDEVLICNVKSYKDAKENLVAYFLENREYYELRANVFGYVDDHVRFALLSKGCLEWLIEVANAGGWQPDIIHCNDWHTGYLIELARRDKRYAQIFSKIPIIFTIHNFAYQGNFDFRYAQKNERDDGTKKLAPLLSPKLQKQNALLRGILYADVINTVSPTHAVEVLSKEYAEGLEVYLQKARNKLTGILNGIDTNEFNPAKDSIIKKRYSKTTFAKNRPENKQHLQKTFSLTQDANAPLFAMTGRLSAQKGWDLLLEMLPHLFEARNDTQLIVLGGGEERYRDRLLSLSEKYPNRLALHLHSDFKLPHKLFAGADMFLIPSAFEPGGIVALEALRYGAVPIVRRTGGLNDIIVDFNPATGEGNGFSFNKKDPWALFAVIIEALAIYRQPLLWQNLIYNCMACDFSWDKAAQKYDALYKKVIKRI